MKKLISLFAAIVLTFSLLAPAYASYDDAYAPAGGEDADFVGEEPEQQDVELPGEEEEYEEPNQEADEVFLAEAEGVELLDDFTDGLDGSGTEEAPYILETGEHLRQLRDNVNAGTTYEGVYFRLSGDISLKDDTNWSGIGLTTSTKRFCGVFDGDGHSVTMNVSTETGTGKALFYVVGATGVVKNLTVKGIVSGKGSCAGIVYHNYGRIENCVNMADVSSFFSTIDTAGVAARNYGTVSGCVNKGDIIVTEAQYVGGVVGCNFGRIENCGNEGLVSAARSGSYNAFVGGIAGRMYSDTSGLKDLSIENCYNWGNVRAKRTDSGNGYFAAAGGIVGGVMYYGSGYTFSVKNCYSKGTLTAASPDSNTRIGGAVGRDSGTASSPQLALESCYWLDGTADEAYTPYNDSIDNVAASGCAAYSDNAELLTKLNAYADENGLKAWVADTGYDSQPAFGVSDVAKRTITFTGDYEGTVLINDGTRVTLPTCTEEGHYYTFTVDGESFDGSDRIYADTEIVVTKNIYTYTVTYDAAPGTGDVPEESTHDWNSTVTVEFSPEPTRLGYTFAGWKDGDTVYTKDGVNTFVITEDVTLHAVYKAYDFAGTGTEKDPYIVDGIDAFKAFAGYVDDEQYGSAYYLQTVDIDLTDSGFTQVGSMTGYLLSADNVYFKGSYDGGGHSITNYTYAGQGKAAGLFAGLSSATIKDLTLTGSVAADYQYAGGLAAYAFGTTVIDGCTVNMNIESTNTSAYVGGIVGYTDDDLIIRNSSHTGDVISAGTYAGGIAGQVGDSTAIINCYQGTGRIASTRTGNYTSGAGGIAGYAGTNTAVIRNCYSNTENVSIASTYSSAGAGLLIGAINTYSPTVENCFYVRSDDCTLSAIGYYKAASYGTPFVDTTKRAASAGLLASQLNKLPLSDSTYKTWGIVEGENGGYPVFGEPSTDELYVIYDLNGADGEAPEDTTAYAKGQSVTVLAKSDDITWSYHEFLGWAKDKNAAAAEYAAGDTFEISGNTVLYAVWKEITAWGGTGTERTISDAAGMIELADKINSENGKTNTSASFEGYTFTLTADIDLSDTDFAPIGYYTSYSVYNGFNGTFDGNGYTVTIKLSGSVQGVFGYTNTEAVIKNLNVAGSIAAENSTDSNLNSMSCSGGIVGYNKGTVSGCVSSVSITGASAGNIGGIVGKNEGTISGCFYDGGEISGLSYVGGIAGRSTAPIYSCAARSGSVKAAGTTYTAYAGGIVGYTTNHVYNSYNWADVCGYYAGGIAGYSSAQLRNNYSTGSITLSGTAGYAGGIVGNITGTNAFAQNNYWLAGSAEKAAGADGSTKATRNSAFDESGKLADVPNLLNPLGAASTSGGTTLIGWLNAWVTDSLSENDQLKAWKGSARPVFEDESLGNAVKVTFTGDYEGELEVESGADAVLPEAPTGFEFIFTVNGEAWDGKNITADVTVLVTKKEIKSETGNGTQADPYQISTEADLIKLADEVAAGDSKKGKYYKLMNDITCTEAFTGIGEYSFQNGKPFSGNIDGDGHFVEVTINNTVNLKGAAFINYVDGVSVKNLTVKGTISTINGAAGGIAAYVANGTFDKCVNEAALSGNIQTAGGIVGMYAMSKVGTVTISRCINKGSINSTFGTGGIGGIIGSDGLNGSANCTATITECVNRAKITVSGTNSTAGGIAGSLMGSISDSYCIGEDNGDLSYTVVENTNTNAGAGCTLGGVVGNLSGSVRNCYNVGNVTAESAKVTKFGGIKGTTTGTVINSYYRDDAVADGAVEGGTALDDTDEMYMSDDFRAKLGDKFGYDEEDEEKFWHAEGYPYLKWEFGEGEEEPTPDPETVTVTFVGDYTGTLTVDFGGDAELPANPENGTYAFTVNGTAWDGKNLKSDVTVTVTLTRYSYKVTFKGDYNGEQTVLHGDSAVLPECTESGKIYRFTADGKVWTGANITSNVTVTVTMVDDPQNDYDKWDGVTATKWTNGKGTQINPYLIETAENLAFLQKQVKAGNLYPGQYFKVTNDLDMTAADWEPIGKEAGTMGAFNGTLDGDGHSICIRAVGSASAGLFGNLGSEAVIKNVVIEGSVTASGGTGVGAIAGDNHGTIDGCINRAVITSTGAHSEEYGCYAGGIAGRSYFGTIRNCGNEGTVVAKSYAGGIVGDNYAYNSSAFVENCYNWGSVSGAYAGGIVGSSAAGGTIGSGSGISGITNCYSTGTLGGIGFGIVGFIKSSDYYQTNYGSPTLQRCWYLDTTARSAEPTGNLTGASAITFADYGKLLTNLNTSRIDSWSEWFADPSSDMKPCFREKFADSHVIVFMADGNRVATKVFSEGDTAVAEPMIPAKTGYVAMWEEYELGNEDITVNAVYRLIGDVNNDGNVNAVDAMLTLRHAATLVELDGISLLAADVNGDASVNSSDASLILQYSVGKINTFN